MSSKFLTYRLFNLHAHRRSGFLIRLGECAILLSKRLLFVDLSKKSVQGFGLCIEFNSHFSHDPRRTFNVRLSGGKAFGSIEFFFVLRKKRLKIPTKRVSCDLPNLVFREELTREAPDNLGTELVNELIKKHDLDSLKRTEVGPLPNT